MFNRNQEKHPGGRLDGYRAEVCVNPRTARAKILGQEQTTGVFQEQRGGRHRPEQGLVGQAEARK